jgi:hypothetical protein
LELQHLDTLVSVTNEMSERREARRLGGLAAFVLGAGVFILFPTLGLIEAPAGIWVLTTRSAAIGLVAVLPSALVLAYAVQGMVGSNRADYRIPVPIAIVSAVTVLLLIRGVRRPEPQPVDDVVAQVDSH